MKTYSQFNSIQANIKKSISFDFYKHSLVVFGFKLKPLSTIYTHKLLYHLNFLRRFLLWLFISSKLYYINNYLWSTSTASVFVLQSYKSLSKTFPTFVLGVFTDKWNSLIIIIITEQIFWGFSICFHKIAL